MKLTCPSCKKVLTAGAEMAGKKGKCPDCGSAFAIPVPQSTSAPAPTQTCPACHAPISTLAAACGTCGYRLSAARPAQASEQERSHLGLIVGLSAGAGIVLLTLVVVILLWPSSDGDEAAGRAPTPEPRPVAAAKPESPISEIPAPNSEPHLPGALPAALEWMCQDAPFDVREFLEPIPREENAAPLYLDALAEFSAKMTNRFPEPERTRRHAITSQRENRFHEIFDRWRENPGSADHMTIDRVLEEYEPGLRQLAEAQRRPRCKFAMNVTWGDRTPHYAAAREVCRVIQLRVARDVELGDFDAAVRHLDTLLHFCGDFRRGCTEYFFVVSAIEGVCHEDILASILIRPDIQTGYCARLLDVLTRAETAASGPVGEWARVEYVLLRQLLHDIKHRTGYFAPRATQQDASTGADATKGASVIEILVGSGYSLEVARQAEAVLATMTPADYAAEVTVLNELYGRLEKTASLPYAERPPHLDRCADDIVEKKSLLRLFVWRALRRWHPFVELEAKSKAKLAGSQCLAALKRWQLEHPQQPPPDLATVCRAAGLAHTPIDPYDDRPLRMTTIDGQPVIYSIGPDAKDNQARIVNEYWTWKRDGDCLFRLPAVKPNAVSGGIPAPK